MFNILFLSDVVGRVGRRMLKENVSDLKKSTDAHVVIANGENSAGGLGIDPGTAEEIFSAGVDIITTGNHVWNKKDIHPFLNENSSRIIRPLNYPAGAPGRGWTVWQGPGDVSLVIVNLIGRVFMTDLVDCPFRAVEELIREELDGLPLRFIDFHAEATSEKVAMGYHLDGQVTAVVGTHTHIQTADERVLPEGTAYITDAGMCGPRESVIGVKHDLIVSRFLSGLPVKFDTAKGVGQINGVLIRSNEQSGKAIEIERIVRIEQ